jgi:hypothetical protein
MINVAIQFLFSYKKELTGGVLMEKKILYFKRLDLEPCLSLPINFRRYTRQDLP